jgi:hypothetical protein
MTREVHPDDVESTYDDVDRDDDEEVHPDDVESEPEDEKLATSPDPTVTGDDDDEDAPRVRVHLDDPETEYRGHGQD